MRHCHSILHLHSKYIKPRRAAQLMYFNCAALRGLLIKCDVRGADKRYLWKRSSLLAAPSCSNSTASVPLLLLVWFVCVRRLWLSTKRHLLSKSLGQSLQMPPSPYSLGFSLSTGQFMMRSFRKDCLPRALLPLPLCWMCWSCCWFGQHLLPQL